MAVVASVAGAITITVVGTQHQDMVKSVKKSTIPTTSRGHLPKCLTFLEKKVTSRDAMFPRQTLKDSSSLMPNLHQVWAAAE
jgi:hypothetical protein